MEQTETRHVAFEMRDVSSDGLNFEGYAAVFNDWAEIEGRNGKWLERFSPGSFDKTLGERTPAFLFNHGLHPMIGDMPLGVFTSIKPEKRGLFVQARMSDNWLTQPVRDAIRDGAITGMSVRMQVPHDKEKWDRSEVRTGGLPRRSILECKCFDAGPVVMPAYAKTTASLRSRELLDSFADPQVRAELARLLLATSEDGVDPDAADRAAQALDGEAGTPALPVDEPTGGHSPRPRSQRVAIATLVLEGLPK